MSWNRVQGTVVKGHRVASGEADDPRFPEGTLALQRPHFKDRGLEIGLYHPGTVNVSIEPHAFSVRKARYTFRQVKWAADEPAEDFSFFDCRVLYQDQIREGLVYYPHPETKPEHFQDPHVLEVLTDYLAGLSYGDEILLELPADQIAIHYSDKHAES